MRATVLVVTLLLIVAWLGAPRFVQADQPIGSAVHAQCMDALLLDAVELNKKFRGLVGAEADWDILVSVIMESYHKGCFGVLGVGDNREELDQMPWVEPVGQLCTPRQEL